MSDHTEPVAGQNANNENLKNNSIRLHTVKPSGRGGARPGAGRPKGSISLATKERLAIRKAFEDRIHNNADKLLSAALNKALGESFLFHRYKVGSGSKERMETEIVTDPEIIKSYLDDELNDTEDEYYYISTKPVDMVAVKELYDRAFGKPLQKNELTGKDGNDLNLGLTPEQAEQLLRLRASRGPTD